MSPPNVGKPTDRVQCVTLEIDIYSQVGARSENYLSRTSKYTVSPSYSQGCNGYQPLFYSIYVDNFDEMPNWSLFTWPFMTLGWNHEPPSTRVSISAQQYIR